MSVQIYIHLKPSKLIFLNLVISILFSSVVLTWAPKDEFQSSTKMSMQKKIFFCPLKRMNIWISELGINYPATCLMMINMCITNTFPRIKNLSPSPVHKSHSKIKQSYAWLPLFLLKLIEMIKFVYNTCLNLFICMLKFIEQIYIPI